MKVSYKFDVLSRLKEAGYTTYKLRTGKLLSEGTIQKLREGNTSITLETACLLCGLIGCTFDELINYELEEGVPTGVGESAGKAG